MIHRIGSQTKVEFQGRNREEVITKDNRQRTTDMTGKVKEEDNRHGREGNRQWTIGRAGR